MMPVPESNFGKRISYVSEPPPEHNLMQLVNDLKKANAELREARRAALNLMEDAVLSKEALRKSEERLRITLESAVDFAIINTNPNGLVETWNSGAERIFGYTAEEIIGKSADVIFTEEDQAANIPDKEMATAREKGLAEDERWHRRKDGSRFYVSGVLRPVYNPSLTGYVKIVRDMTEQKLLEQKKDEFIAIASHELKTPVTSIKAYAEFLRDTFKEVNDQENFDLIVKLNAQVDRLTELINSLFDTTKISEGQLMLSVERFDIHLLIEEYIHELQHTAQNHKLVFLSNGEAFVTADKERIAQVLINLISNAIKYSPRGGDVTISLERKEAGVQVSVKDNGVGISEDIKDKIFERFYRATDSQISTYPGMGLGLYISAAIIKRHKGTIWVESKLSEGSTFYFYLPYNTSS